MFVKNTLYPEKLKSKIY